MAPFPPIDHLELGQRHALILQLILGYCLIFIEFKPPVFYPKRWYRPSHRPPLGDAETTIGQTGEPTHQNHQHHKAKEQDQPKSDHPPAATGRCIDQPPGSRHRRGRLLGNIFKNTAAVGHYLPPFGFCIRIVHGRVGFKPIITLAGVHHLSQGPPTDSPAAACGCRASHTSSRRSKTI